MWCSPSSAIVVSSSGRSVTLPPGQVVVRTTIPRGSVALVATPAPSLQLLSPRELRAWRGLLRVHARIVKALDAELEAEHGLAVTTYEVLLFLSDAPDGRMRMHDLASSVLLSR